MTSLASPQHPPPHGMLLVASDIAPADEAEFNRWYDREHVHERVRIPGFLSGARYRALPHTAPGTRRYLGLYRTQSLAVFTNAAYRAAFAQQTDWSVTNLGRMQSPMRRVCAVQAVTGAGSGGELAVLPLQDTGDMHHVLQRMDMLGPQLQEQPGFVQSYLLTPDAALSTPLPRESTENRPLFPLLVLESSVAQAALLTMAAEQLATNVDQAWCYALGWKLYASDLTDDHERSAP